LHEFGQQQANAAEPQTSQPHSKMARFLKASDQCYAQDTSN